MNEFKRKQWTRIGLSILAVAVAVLFLAGIVGGKPMTYQVGVNPNATAVTEKGFGGEVTAHVELDGDGAVKSLSVDTPDETEGLGKRASDAEFTDQFVGKTGPFTFGENGIEAISGATVTSDAVLKAVNRAITGEEAAEEEQPAAEEAKAEEPEAGETPAAAAEASEKGFGGNVTVHLELNEDQTVKSLAIDTPDETAGLGQRASEAEFTDQFIGKAGPFAFGTDGIEALSGATVTSEAALKAINSFYGAAPAAEEEQPAEAPAGTKEGSAAGEPVYGSYLSDQKTDYSTIRILVSTKDDEITSCRITSEGDYDYLTDEIRTAWAKAIVENQTADTDAITGATLRYSARAVKEAVADIRQQMSGEAPEAAEQPAETPAEEQPAEQPTEVPAEEKPVEQPTETPAEEQPTEQPAEEPAAESGEAADASAPAPYGAYQAVRETDFSVIRVIASTKDGKITDCKITSEAKNEGSDYLTDEIRTAWAKAIVENQGAEADAITGATLKSSASAVREAVAEILQKMTGNAPAAEEQPAEQPAEEPAAEQPEAAPAEGTDNAAEASPPAPYGAYQAVRETDFSVIRVIASTKDGVITDCKITSEAKNEGSDYLTDEIRTAWAKAIVENQGAEADAITGATLKSSAGAVREAVAEILEKIR